MALPLLVLALEFHRAPLRYRHLTDPRRPLPEAFGDWLTESGAALAPANVEATATALGTTPDSLREAYLFLLRQILLISQADYYRVLGLSRRCHPESIKQHRNLLLRLFHPDHVPEDDERSVSLTARINAAYQVLRDPQARRGYDSRLALLAPEQPQDPGAFFRPHDPVPFTYRHIRTPSLPPSQARSLLLRTLASVVAIALLYLVLHEPRQPLLWLDPEPAGGTVQGRSLLRERDGQRETIELRGQIGGELLPRSDQALPPDAGPMQNTDARHRAEAAEQGPTVGPSSPAGPGAKHQEDSGAGTFRAERASTSGDAKAPEPLVNEAGTAVQRQPPQRQSRGEGPQGGRSAVDTPERLEGSLAGRAEPAADPAHAKAISGLVGRLERSVSSGDLAGLTSLFTVNAVVGSGLGAAAVRNAYADMVGQSGQGRMTISGLRWRAGPHERLIGQGAIRISAGPQRGGSEAAGTVEIEIVPWMDDYRISKLIHHLSRK
jgi:curved DNA-binding protein CbpA